MSHDIQLFTNTNLPLTHDELAHGAALAPANGQQASPMKKVQRLLRGRFGLALSLAIIGALVGAFLGWRSQSVQWECDAITSIKPVIPSITSTDKVVPMYHELVQSQVNIINSERVLDRAMDEASWKAASLPTGDDGLAFLRRGLDVNYLQGTQNIQISFTDPDPANAQAAVRSVVQSYQALYSEINGEDATSQLQQIQAMIDKTTLQQRGYQHQIDQIAERYGSDDLSVQYADMQKRLSDLQEKLQRAQTMLASANLTGINATTQPTASNLTLEQLGQMDATMRTYLQTADDTQFNIRRLMETEGANSPVVARAKQDLALQLQRIDNYAGQLRQAFSGAAILPPDGLDRVPLTKEQLANLQTGYQSLTQQYDNLKEQAHALNEDNSTILKLKAEIKQCEQDLEKYDHRYEEKLAEAAFGGTLTIVEDGSTPQRAPDKRKQMAFLGFVFGGAFPIGLLLLIGLLDARYRYSEEPTADMGGLSLLGILPNLPDRLTDPAQAATAAHCVHQIRTMLQVNSSEDRKVYAVTSASPGDGKTSLTLALGLSFAASGSRTLLIDCDLVGAGLTARLDMNGPDGVLEAMAQRALLPFVRTTDVADLAMLPVGTAQGHHAGMFAPAALKRILDEARKHFDVILIDSGPILGSIEATPVCAAADGVVLTVSRGQQRPIVEKAMHHLRSVGARIAGVVFNRAQARDFERSVSGMSLRSVHRQHDPVRGHANGNGGFRKATDSGATAFGPVARAVASSVKNPDSGERP